MRLRAIVIVAALSAASPAPAQEPLKAAVSQRGQWDTAVTELGVRSSIFKKHGIRRAAGPDDAGARRVLPKPTMWPDEVKGIDLTMADAVKNRFLATPLA